MGRGKQTSSIVILVFILLSTVIALASIYLKSPFDALFIHLISCPHMCCTWLLSATLLTFFILTMSHFSFLLQLEESAVDLFMKTVKDDSLAIDLDVAQKPRSISQYIQAWHNQIWEMGFVGFFRGKESYTKTKAFVDQRKTNIAVKQVVYRYEFNS